MLESGKMTKGGNEGGNAFFITVSGQFLDLSKSNWIKFIPAICATRKFKMVVAWWLRHIKHWIRISNSRVNPGPSSVGGPVVTGPPFEIFAHPFHVLPPGCCICRILYLKNVPPFVAFGPTCCEILATGLSEPSQVGNLYSWYADGCWFDSLFSRLRAMQHCGCNKFMSLVLRSIL